MAGITDDHRGTLLHPLIIIDFASDKFYIGRTPEPGLINVGVGPSLCAADSPKSCTN